MECARLCTTVKVIHRFFDWSRRGEMTHRQLCADSAVGNDDVPSACHQRSRQRLNVRRHFSGERSGAKRLRRKAVVPLLTALVGSTALLLGGCRTDSTFEFKADGSVRTEIVFEDDTGSMQTLKGNCDELKTVISALGRFLAEAKVENVTRPGGALTCKATSSTVIDGINLEKTGDSYSLVYKPVNTKKRDLSRISARTTIVMPGKVLKTNAGSVHGDKVIIDGTDYLTEGFQITSEANRVSSSPSRSAGTRTDSSNEAAGRHSAKKGPPLWIWVVVGTGILFGLVGVSSAFARRKRVKANRTDTGFN